MVQLQISKLSRNKIVLIFEQFPIIAEIQTWCNLLNFAITTIKLDRALTLFASISSTNT